MKNLILFILIIFTINLNAAKVLGSGSIYPDMLAALEQNHLQVTADDIDEKKLESLLKLISSYMKSMTDIQKIFQMLRDNPFESDKKTDKFPFERIIINDEKSYKLAKDLLIRINEVRGSYIKKE